MSNITRQVTDRIWQLVGYGLPHGLGRRGKGSMCVQASVQAALGEQHNDQPLCVPIERRSYGIWLNDAPGWSSNQARGDGLRRYAIAQLGDSKKSTFDFAEKVFVEVLRAFLPEKLKEAKAKVKQQRAAVKLSSRTEAIELCNEAGLDDLAYRIRTTANTVPAGVAETLWRASNDTTLGAIADAAVRVCQEIETEGAEWLKEYDKRKGADLVDWLMEQKEVGRKQEAATIRYNDLKEFLSGGRRRYEPKSRWEHKEEVETCTVSATKTN